jgi:hypothetical protein
VREVFVTKPQMLFQVREGEQSIGEFPTLWQAGMTWNENASKRQVIRIDGEGNTLQEYTAAECRKALRDAANVRVGSRLN